VLQEPAQPCIGQPTRPHRVVPVVHRGHCAKSGPGSWLTSGMSVRGALSGAGGSAARSVPLRLRHHQAATLAARTTRARSMSGSPCWLCSIESPSSSFSRGTERRAGTASSLWRVGLTERPMCTTVRHERHRVAVVARVSKVVSHRGHWMVVMGPASL
jgi:hypothetical protein